MKHNIILLITAFLLLSTISVKAQKKISTKFPGKPMAYLEIGYMKGYKYIYPNVKLKIGIQKAYFNLFELSLGYWNFSNNHGDVFKKDRIRNPNDYNGKIIYSKISVNAFDFGTGIVPIDSKNNYLSLGAGLTVSNIKSHYPYEAIFTKNGLQKVNYRDQNKWIAGTFYFLKYYHNIYHSFFAGVSFYYYSISGFKEENSVEQLDITPHNANINIGYRF